MRTVLIYSPDYDLHFMGIEKLHPFDGRKYSRAWNVLFKKYGQSLRGQTIKPDYPATRDDLLLAHHPDYLDTLETSKTTVVQALELGILLLLPLWLIKWRVVTPMLLASRGTLLAADACLEYGFAVNFSGGYHHASSDNGEGFCLFSDIAMAVVHLRNQGIVSSERQAMILDLDAHQGNGHERIFYEHDDVYIVDMYNREIYPEDTDAKDRIDYSIGLKSGTTTDEYLQLLKHHLPMAFVKAKNPSVVIYIAGTDIYTHDQLGGLDVSPDGIFERDKFVIDLCREKNIPCIILPGGGYSSESYKMIARTVDYLIST